MTPNGMVRFPSLYGAGLAHPLSARATPYSSSPDSALRLGATTSRDGTLEVDSGRAVAGPAQKIIPGLGVPDLKFTRKRD